MYIISFNLGFTFIDAVILVLDAISNGHHKSKKKMLSKDK